MSNTWFDNAFSTAKSSKKPLLFKIPSASLISKPNQTLNGISQLTSRKRVKSEDSGDIYKQPSSSKQQLCFTETFHLTDIEPKASKDLALTTQKVKELKSWFAARFSDVSTSPQQAPKSPFLLLNGPAGSGKTTAIKVLCTEFNVKLIELPAISKFKDDDLFAEYKEDSSIQGRSANRNNFDDEFDPIRPIYDESQQNCFDRFIYDLNRCPHSIFDNERTQKLLLIEDIPQIFHMKPELLSDVLADVCRHFKNRTVPIVFIISDIVNGPSVESKVLPRATQVKLGFEVITVKPVTDASLAKVLNKVPLRKKLSDSELQEVIQASSNDIRNAFNYLSFKHSELFGKPVVPSKKAPIKRPKIVSTKEQKLRKRDSSNSLQSGREEHLTLVHAIGKILYAKRTPCEDLDTVAFLRANPAIDRLLLRNPLMEQLPESIAERSNVSCDTVSNWVFENYHDFLNDDDISHAVDCLEVLSVTNSHFRDFESRSAMEDLRTSYLIRGQMFSLNRDSSAYPGGPDNVAKMAKTFRPLRGPKFWKMHNDTNDSLAKLVALKDSSFYDSSIVELDKNLVLDILPCAGKLVQVQQRLLQLSSTQPTLKLGHFVAEIGEFAHPKPFFNSNRAFSHEDNDFTDSTSYSSLAKPLATPSQPFVLVNHRLPNTKRSLMEEFEDDDEMEIEEDDSD